ncbi:MAG: immune inhibitor A [Chloroflexota bacterium]|nr:immune inhibitor A [Chloroflexota bacterium]
MGHRQHWAAWATCALILCVALTGCAASFWATTPAPRPIGPGCPLWTSPTNQPDIAPPASAAPADVAAYNARLVSQTRLPPRNLYTLTQNVVYHKQGHIACQTTLVPAQEQVGQERRFWVINPSQSGYHRITARLAYVTPHLYVYVQDGAPVDYLALKASADRFEATTYDLDRAVFGDQWSLGPDHEPRITLLNAINLGAVGGYFSSADEYPTSINPYSNARQMIYLNLSGGARPGSAFYDATLAHEFQHMIHWWARPEDPSWINEGMSVLAQRLNGYPTNSLEQAYFAAPQTPLVNGWTDDALANLPRYGAGYAFMDYFYEHYGGDQALRALMASGLPVPRAFDDALAKLGSHDHFDDVFAKFLAANLLNDPSVARGAYAYRAFSGERAHLTATAKTFPYTTQGALAQYGAAYYDLRPPTGGSDDAQTLTVNFAGAPMTTILPNQPQSPAKSEWWSGSGDNMDSTLTRAVDLSAVPTGPVALTFDAWYDLEPGFDYTYVEASQDGGATWTTLPVTTGTKANPNGENLGIGMTGVSGGGDQPAWTRESVDLTPYDGAKVLLRFETVTDDAVHDAGFALDAVSIVAIKYSSDAAQDDGWTANGWIRTTNTLPQPWSAQVVVYYAGGKAPTVQRLKVDALTGQASASISNFGGAVSHVAVIVSPMAVTTWTTAPYDLTATLG